MRTKLDPYGHALDTADKVGTQSFHRSGRFHILDIFEHLEFKAREVGSEAKVFADPERNMRIGIAREVELERFVENVLVAIGGGIV